MSNSETESVKHGHWIDAEGKLYSQYCISSYGKGYYECSVCGKVSWLAKNDPYCRECGAKMDSEKEEK